MALIGHGILVLLDFFFFLKKRVNAILIACGCYKNAQGFSGTNRWRLGMGRAETTSLLAVRSGFQRLPKLWVSKSAGLCVCGFFWGGTVFSVLILFQLDAGSPREREQ